MDIKSEFEAVRRLLTDDGRLYIEVPGIKAIKYYGYDFLKYFQNAHNYAFTLNTLRQTLYLCGFTSIFGNEFICSVFVKSEIPKNPVIQNYYRDAIDYMFAIENHFYMK